MSNEQKVNCNHDLDSPNTSIVIMKKQTMAYPPTKSGYCKCCGKIFTLNKNNKGKFSLAN